MNNLFTERIYLTNNICKYLNGKIRYYLNKKPTNNLDFVTCINKLFTNSKFKEEDIIRHDFVTRTLICIINKFNLNINPKWKTYEKYIEVHKNIIKDNSYNLNNDDLTKLINLINNLNIIDNNNNIENQSDNNNN